MYIFAFFGTRHVIPRKVADRPQFLAKVADRPHFGPIQESHTMCQFAQKTGTIMERDRISLDNGLFESTYNAKQLMNF